MGPTRLYRDQSAWKALQQFLPASLRLESEADAPQEEFWLKDTSCDAVGRLAQWQSASFTRMRSQVQNLHRPPLPLSSGRRSLHHTAYFLDSRPSDRCNRTTCRCGVDASR